MISAAVSSLRWPRISVLICSNVKPGFLALNETETRDEAASILRGLIDEVRLVPDDGKLRVHLVGQLAALFALAHSKQARAQKHLRPGPLSEIGP